MSYPLAIYRKTLELVEIRCSNTIWISLGKNILETTQKQRQRGVTLKIWWTATYSSASSNLSISLSLSIFLLIYRNLYTYTYTYFNSVHHRKSMISRHVPSLKSSLINCERWIFATLENSMRCPTVQRISRSALNLGLWSLGFLWSQSLRLSRG